MIDTAELNPASDHCQRWTGGRHSWRHADDGGFDPRRYDVAELGEAAARAYVLAHHYSASYPASSRRYGLYEGAALLGVAVLSVPASAGVLTGVFPDLAPYAESLELGRLVLADRVPANGESWMLARVFELAAAAGVRGIVSFSDPVARSSADGRVIFPGHRGIIYQAANATYCGRGRARILTLLPDGTVLSDRAIQKLRAGERGADYVERSLRDRGAPRRAAGRSAVEWLPEALEAIGARRLRHRGNYRYAFRLGSKAERRHVRIALPAEAYPKALEAA